MEKLEHMNMLNNLITLFLNTNFTINLSNPKLFMLVLHRIKANQYKYLHDRHTYVHKLVYSTSHLNQAE